MVKVGKVTYTGNFLIALLSIISITSHGSCNNCLHFISGNGEGEQADIHI